METGVKKDTHFFIYMELDHHMPVIQLVSFIEQTHVSSEQPLVDYCTTPHEEHLLVASDVEEEETCFSPYSLNLITVVHQYLSMAIVLAKEDAEMHLHDPQTKTKHSWL